MSEHEPVTLTMRVSEARQEFGELLDRVSRRETRVLVEQDGVPVAAIVSADDLEWLHEMEARREDGWQAIQEIRALNLDKTPEEVERDVAEELEAMRAERRVAERRAPAATPTA